MNTNTVYYGYCKNSKDLVNTQLRLFKMGFRWLAEGQRVKWLKLNSCPKNANIVFKKKKERVVKPDFVTVIWKDKKENLYGCCEYDWS